MYGFNADEVFEMAIKIEENGAAFYRKAAGLQPDESNRKFLESMAVMEDHHKAVFDGMKQDLADIEKTEMAFDPQEDLSLYLSAMADHHGGEGDPKAADALSGKETMEEIIATAIGLEKESILFYLGLKDMVSPKYGQDKIDNIIQEERKHVIQLNALYKKLNKK